LPTRPTKREGNRHADSFEGENVELDALPQTVGEEVVLFAGGDRLQSDVIALANEVGSAALLRCPLPCAARLDQLSRKSRKNDKIAASDVARPHVNWITLLRAYAQQDQRRNESWSRRD
jgi:hypothetical protein